jgi:hypothetical protein
MPKFKVRVKMTNGDRESFEVERESYHELAGEIQGDVKRWFGVEGRFVNKSQIVSVEIEEV